MLNSGGPPGAQPDPAYKFGEPDGLGGDRQVFHRDTYDLEQTTGAPRLVIAPRCEQTRLVADLADGLAGPFYLLYVLVVSRTGRREARYQSAATLSPAELRGFLSRHASFLENDGRHHLWVGSVTDGGLLVYDRHNVIYAYGPLTVLEEILQRRGFHREPVRFPGPHSHHYHASYDGAEDQLFADGEWVEFPLQERDDK